MATISIRPADTEADLAEVKQLFREYADALGVDLGFQGFEEELATLPGKYAAPTGRLLLAADDLSVLGCVALRSIRGKDCEMKRLYVRPRARGAHLGRLLVERVCVEARDLGYSRICLDTLPSMTAAQTLYESLGFKAIDPYVFNPVPGTKFLALELLGVAVPQHE